MLLLLLVLMVILEMLVCSTNANRIQRELLLTNNMHEFGIQTRNRRTPKIYRFFGKRKEWWQIKGHSASKSVYECMYLDQFRLLNIFHIFTSCLPKITGYLAINYRIARIFRNLVAFFCFFSILVSKWESKNHANSKKKTKKKSSVSSSHR